MQSKRADERAAGFAALKVSSDLEFTHAQVLLGNCYLTGFNGMKKDPRKAANLFRLAAERGNAFGMVSLGVCYFMGEGVSKDEGKSMKWLNAALAPDADYSSPPAPVEVMKAEMTAHADADVAGTMEVDPVSERQAAAHSILGVLYTQQKKLPEAQAHFVAAATAGPNGRSGILMASVAAAVNYAFGQGVPRDMAKASEMLERSKMLSTRLGVTLVQNSVAMKLTDSFAAAEVEDQMKDVFGRLQSQLQLTIANSLADKKSKTYDLAEAVKWYEVAAENGQVWAMLPLAQIYYRGDLGHPEPEKAFKWFEASGSGNKPKHFLGVANLAICYQNGLGTAKDTDKAAELFKKWRNTDIVCYLGSIGQCPAKPMTYEEVLALNETWAKKKNDPQAQYLMGVRYRRGWGVPIDYVEATSWFKKAAKTGHGEALNQLGELVDFSTIISVKGSGSSDKMFKEPLEYYKKAAAAGSVAGMLNYARMVQNGLGAPENVPQAEALYRQALAMDSTAVFAHLSLGIIEEAKLRAAITAHEEASAQVARSEMLEHYEAARSLDDPRAATNLGIIYMQGELVEKNLRKAYACFEDAAARGSAIAHYALGLMHERGEGVPVTYTEAAYHYRLAALEGNADALRRLINFYLSGQGVSLDLDQAAFWLDRMQKMTGSQQVLTTYCDVMLKKHAYDNALTMLKDLTKSRDPQIAGFAYDRLSVCYTEELGVKADPSQARKYSEKAIKLGFGDALTRLAIRQKNEGHMADAVANLRKALPTSRLANYHLGLMYYNGDGVPKDEAQGVKYLQSAADANHTGSQVFLANLTLHHSPSAPSLQQAINYASQAEANGRAEAGTVREELEKRQRGAEDGSDAVARPRSS